jgi:hypothetical protein
VGAVFAAAAAVIGGTLLRAGAYAPAHAAEGAPGAPASAHAD